MGWRMEGMTPGLWTLKEKGNININVSIIKMKKKIKTIFVIHVCIQNCLCSCNQRYVLKDVCPCNNQQSTWIN